jgi:DNA-binding SARP family transcriptional activator
VNFVSDLHLAFLGLPEVHHDGRLISFRTRKVMALLVYLAVEGGMHSREKLTTLLWPESDEPQGRMVLRRTLLLLRQGLHEESESPLLAHIIVEREALGCNLSSNIHLDLQIVKKVIDLSREHSLHLKHTAQQSERDRAVVAQLLAAVAVYRGNFLDGFSLDDAPEFDDWMRMQRHAWHNRINLVFDRLSLLQSHRGEIEDAIEVATRWLVHEPLNETVYQRLLQLYLTIGNRDAALRTYEACHTMLAEELHAKPAPETEALHARIRMTANISSSSPVFRSSRLQAKVESSSSMLVEGPLVGRTDEYSQLVETFYRTTQGQTLVVILTGEAGIGKTRLAKEFLHWAAAHGADVLQGGAFETGGRLSYQPLVESLRSRIERENAPDDLLSDTWLAELSRLLPELRDRYPDLQAPEGDEATARNRLFEAMSRLGHALAKRTPVVLFIDDVQWADADSLDLLSYVGRRWTEMETPLLLILNMRSESLINSNTLAQWLAGLEHDLSMTSLKLSVLQYEDTLRLLLSLGKGDSDTETQGLAQFAQWLFAETGGQPFYIVEMLKALLEREVLVSSQMNDGSWAIDLSSAANGKIRLLSMLPSSIRDIIRSRLAQLTVEAFALLAAGAVLGHGFTFERVCKIADLKESEGLPALDEVLKNQVLQEASAQGETEVRYFFVHDKIRDIIYTEAGDARRRIFHRRALEILELELVHPGELAHHALAAGLKEPAFRYNVAAGNHAMELFAVRDAIGYYEQSRQVLLKQSDREQFLVDVHMPVAQHLYDRLGRAYELINEWEQVDSIYQSMLGLAQELHFPEMECVALNRLATLAVHKSFDLEQALSFLQSALQIAEAHGDIVGLAETEWGLAQVHNYRFDAQAALVHGNHA